MEQTLEQLIKEVQSLRIQIKDLRTFADAQQESVSSLIALSQQQTSIIEQQNVLIQKLATS